MKLTTLIALLLVICSSLFGAKYIAVLDLESTGVSDTEAKILTQTLTSRIISLGEYIVVERANIDKILKEQKFQHSGCTDSECAVEIGQLLNADLTVIGSAGKIGSTYTIQVRIINVESGEALRSADFTHKGEIDELLSVGVDAVAHELLGLPYTKRITTKTSSNSGYGANLQIVSEPHGAEIFIGDNYYDITPLVLEDFPPGEYNITFKLQGYENYSQSVQLLPRGSKEIKAILTPFLSKITFLGTPAPNKVSIKIDNNSLLSINKTNVKHGKHIIHISKEGFSSIVDTITTSPGQYLNYKYTLDCEWGELQFELPTKFNPYCKINDEYLIKYSKKGNQSFSLFKGKYSLEIDKPDYEFYKTIFEIEPCETTTLNINPTKRKGEFEIEKRPIHTELFIDGNKFTESKKLEYGAYEITASAKNYYSQVLNATINNPVNPLQIQLLDGMPDLQKLKQKKKWGYVSSIVFAGLFIAELGLTEYYYDEYDKATSSKDAQKHRDNVELFTQLKTPTAIALCASSGFVVYHKVSIDNLMKKLSLK